MTDLEKLTDLILGHACTMVCPYCAGGIKATANRKNWYHPDVLGRPLGHACQASSIRNADPKEVARLSQEELAKKTRIFIPNPPSI